MELGSPLVHTCWQEWNLWEEEEGMGTTSYGLVGPNSQATAQKHNGHPICLSGYTLWLGTTLKGLTEAGVWSGWLAWQCYGWELACEGRGMSHMVLRAKVWWAEGWLSELGFQCEWGGCYGMELGEQEWPIIYTFMYTCYYHQLVSALWVGCEWFIYCNFISWVKASSCKLYDCMPALESPIWCGLCSPRWCTKELNGHQTQVLHSIGIHVNEYAQHCYDDQWCRLGCVLSNPLWVLAYKRGSP